VCYLANEPGKFWGFEISNTELTLMASSSKWRMAKNFPRYMYCVS